MRTALILTSILLLPCSGENVPLFQLLGHPVPHRLSIVDIRGVDLRAWIAPCPQKPVEYLSSGYIGSSFNVGGGDTLVIPEYEIKFCNVMLRPGNSSLVKMGHYFCFTFLTDVYFPYQGAKLIFQNETTVLSEFYNTRPRRDLRYCLEDLKLNVTIAVNLSWPQNKRYNHHFLLKYEIEDFSYTTQGGRTTTTQGGRTTTTPEYIPIGSRVPLVLIVSLMVSILFIAYLAWFKRRQNQRRSAARVGEPNHSLTAEERDPSRERQNMFDPPPSYDVLIASPSPFFHPEGIQSHERGEPPRLTVNIAAAESRRSQDEGGSSDSNQTSPPPAYSSLFPNR